MFWIILCLSVLAVLVGARALMVQFKTGLSNTGLSDRFSWGLYIQGFLTLGSLAGGLLFFAGIMGLFGPLSIVVPHISPIILGCLAGAGLMILADLGKPFRSILLMLGKNRDATMFWDFVTFALCGILAIILWVVGLAEGIPGKIWAVAAILVSSAFLIVHVLLLLSRQGNPVSQPFLALEIFFRGLWSGAALMAIMGTAAPQAAIVTGPLLLIFSIVVLLTHFASGFAKPRPENAPRRNLVGCVTIADAVVVLLLVISMISGGSRGLVGLAGILCVLILVWEKRELLRALQQEAVLPAPYSKWQPAQPYKPSSMELQVGLGAVGVVVLVACIAYLILPNVEEVAMRAFMGGMGGMRGFGF